MKLTGLEKLTVSERETVFGKAFAAVLVTEYAAENGIQYVKALIDGKEVWLVGDPEKALYTYLLGGGAENVKGHC